MSDAARPSEELGSTGAALRDAIERFASGVSAGQEPEALEAFRKLKAALNRGAVRAAERGSDGKWRVNAWVKSGILLGFRLGKLGPAATGGGPRRPT